MPLPHKIATLLYAFHEDGRVLLMERRHDPNRGFFSPPGGKLQTDTGKARTPAPSARLAKKPACNLPQLISTSLASSVKTAIKATPIG